MDFNTSKVIYLDKFPGKEKNPYLRFFEIKTWIVDLIKTFRPEILILESAFMSKFGANSNITLLRLHGYIGMAIMETGVNIKLIPPSSSRAFLKIKPNNKETAFEFIKEKFPEAMLETFKADNDKSDAIILALNAKNENKLKEW